MAESKKEFVKRKKSEKRIQAERQVREAFSKIKEMFAPGTPDESVPIGQAFKVCGEWITWRIKMTPEIEDIYSTIDISKALKIKRERLREWMIREFVKPSLPANNKGTIAIFTRDDVISVALFQKLVDIGFKREAAAEYIDQMIKANLVGAVSFLVMQYVVKDEEPVINIVSQLGNELELKIESNGNILLNKFQESIPESWEGIHIINMLNLEKKVDAALSKLG